MTTFTEARHTAEFILSEANGHRSRENGTVKSGQNLAAGTVVQKDSSTGHLMAFAGDPESSGESDVVGILIAATDATSAAVDAAYLARDAEVNGNLLTYPDGSDALAEAGLLDLGIIVR